MQTIRTILVCISNTEMPSTGLISRALQLGQRFKARLTLLHVNTLAYGLVYPYGMIDVEPGLKLVTDRQSRDLERTAKRLRKAGITVDCRVVRDYPGADAIVRQAVKYKPDLLLVESHRHSRVGRMLLNHTDWELIRNCPCPVWLTKGQRHRNKNLPVLAAIDPFHQHAKPAALDERILKSAKLIAGPGKDRIGLCHVYPILGTYGAGPFGVTVWNPPSPAEIVATKKSVTAAIAREARRYGIPRKEWQLTRGEAKQDLAPAINRWKPAVVVMGVISRRGLRQLFIGDTAEQVIDEVDCDVLIVKPRGFRTSVPKRVRSTHTMPVNPMV